VKSLYSTTLLLNLLRRKDQENGLIKRKWRLEVGNLAILAKVAHGRISRTFLQVEEQKENYIGITCLCTFSFSSF
jgi:hypothetical protein